jgi:hypothetical protein
MSSLSSKGTLPRALAAIAALLLGAAAQMLLESVRLSRAPTPPLAWPLFTIAAGLAIFATWRVRDGEAKLRIEVPAWRWSLRCLPGIALLSAAALMRWMPTYETHARLLGLWSLGILALLIAGAAHALSRRRAQPAPGAGEWTPRQLLLAYAVLAAVAVFMRTAYGFTEHPAWVEADEAYYAVAARDMMLKDPFDWFSLYMVGMPTMQLVPFMATEAMFGTTLWGVRMAGVIMGTLTVLFTFAFARRLAGNVTGFTAALLVAGAHTLVHFARTAQIYTQTPLSAAVTMWLLARAWTGGSLLSWVGAGIALGIGTQTYQASHIMPAVIGLVAAGWTWASDVGWRRAAALTIAVEVIALLLLLPVGYEFYRRTELTAARPKAIYSFSQQNRDALGEKFWPVMTQHVRDCLAIFNTGFDNVANYAATRSMVDAVTAAIIPLAAALVIVGLRSPIGWACAAWVSTFFLFGVILIVPPPTFHRLPAAIVFACFAAAWTFVRLATAIHRGLGLPRAFVLISCLAFGGAAVASNADFYLGEMRRTRPMVHYVAFARLVCRYADSHTVVDATTLDGREFVPRAYDYMSYECPRVKRLSTTDAAGFWDIGKVTEDERVVLIVPQEAVLAHPGTPLGYRIVREYVDETAKYPAPLPLSVYELERAVD